MPMKMRRLVLVAAAAATLSAVAVPVASGARSGHAASGPVIIKTRNVTGLGTILVNGAGRTLYMFVPDKRRRVTCVKECAVIWPPLKLATAKAKAIARGAVRKNLLGSDKDPAGGYVATYNHWPLYLYLGDKKAGTASGQALDENGGYWYVITPSGALIRHKPTKPKTGGGGTPTGPTTTPSTTTTTPSQCLDDDNDGDQNVGGPDDGDGCI